jgi:ABC-type transport system involved in multi-copper enzyme maturation permease subunit
MNQLLGKTELTLLKTEIRKVWGFPILELAVGFIVLVSVATIPKLQEIVAQPEFQTTLTSMITHGVYNSMNAQMLPLGLFCGILVALSFARDYEQGLMQTLLSSPLSRSSIFIVKLVAVVVPLTFLSWGFTMSMVALNYYSTATALATVLQSSMWALLTTFLAVLFYGGLAALISLSIRRTIPAALAAMTIGFLMYFVTTLKADTIGPIAYYLSVTPFKASIVGLGKVLGIAYEKNSLENALPAAGFLAMALLYSLVLLVPMYYYFTRRFEVRE